MKVLNLTNNETSDIKFEVSKFPDGQQQVKILGETSVSYKPTISWNTINNPIQIKSRLNNFKDLELIICATKSLRELGVKEIHLYTPYFLGSRSDRKFEEGSNNYLKDVICPIINSLNFNSVTVIDPHSDVLEACLNNFKKNNNNKLVAFSIGEIYKKYSKIDIHNDKFVLISPDAGANKKVFKTAEMLKYTGDIVTCSKSRDENGKLTRTEVPISNDRGEFLQYLENKDFIIIDDICDGGATFINIAKPIKEYIDLLGLKSKIYLIVTHGIFSKGTTELSHYFDGVYTTNSYRNITALEGLLVKQLNVF